MSRIPPPPQIQRLHGTLQRAQTHTAKWNTLDPVQHGALTPLQSPAIRARFPTEHFTTPNRYTGSREAIMGAIIRDNILARLGHLGATSRMYSDAICDQPLTLDTFPAGGSTNPKRVDPVSWCIEATLDTQMLAQEFADDRALLLLHFNALSTGLDLTLTTPEISLPLLGNQRYQVRFLSPASIANRARQLYPNCPRVIHSLQPWNARIGVYAAISGARLIHAGLDAADVHGRTGYGYEVSYHDLTHFVEVAQGLSQEEQVFRRISALSALAVVGDEQNVRLDHLLLQDSEGTQGEDEALLIRWENTHRFGTPTHTLRREGIFSANHIAQHDSNFRYVASHAEEFGFNGIDPMTRTLWSMLWE